MIYSQDLEVRELIVDESNITGSIFPRRDLNGDYCSLIIVQTNLQESNMTFCGNIVGDIEEHNGDYWVYVTPGTKRLNVRCSHYLPVDIDFKKHNIDKTFPKRTYILTIIGYNSASPTVETKMQGLTINYSPLNATVKINNEEMEASNGLFKTKYPVGKYIYEITAPGYKIHRNEIELNDDKAIHLDITLQPNDNNKNNDVESDEDNKDDNEAEIASIKAQLAFAKERLSAEDRLTKVERDLGDEMNGYVEYKVISNKDKNETKADRIRIFAGQIVYDLYNNRNIIAEFENFQDIDNWYFEEGTKEFSTISGGKCYISVSKKDKDTFLLIIQNGNNQRFRFVISAERICHKSPTPKFGLG